MSLREDFISFLSFVPNEEQLQLIDELIAFLLSVDSQSVFLLKGHAGTGKTSVVSALIRLMKSYNQKTMLLAPTGRAAKVMSSYSDAPAYTIHKKIYQQKRMGEAEFNLAFNSHHHTLFIVDEASMIANGTTMESIYGSGRLLDDLMQYVYGGQGCRMILVGDDAQLAPVGTLESPAMNKDYLRGYGLNVSVFELKQVARQSLNSGILSNATKIRSLHENFSKVDLPKFHLDNFDDILKISGSEIVEKLSFAYDSVGMQDTIVVCRSNKQASIYNRGIRSQVLLKEEEIGAGDLIIVNKNNYFWGKDYEGFEFIANGDIAEVIRVKKHHELYGLHFVDLYVRFLDYDYELDVRILLDFLYADTPEEMKSLSERLYQSVEEDYADIPNKRDRILQMKQDPFFNALQVKFAYAITCHKAQGGQWDTVFLDQGSLSLGLTDDYYRWLYTALTRTKKQLFLVNFPKQCF